MVKTIIDTHAHITSKRFDIDREMVIQNAFGSDVKIIFEIACENIYWNNALCLSKMKNIFVSFGVHPNDVLKITKNDLDKLETFVQNEKCISVGEVGLDYYNLSTKNTNFQKELFEKQINIANKYDKPLVLHCRDSYEDMIDILRKYFNFNLRGVIHCFSGNLEQSKIFIESGFLLGIGGVLTYDKSHNLKNVVFETDISNLVCETDSPYLTPKKYIGQRNEPSYIIETLKEIARIKKMSLSEVAQITTQNAMKLFCI
ncbi:MAG: TatD family hydrolase [Endomicrobium sp.]|jgi:TatD DNase family protein|nr:TatD family hydrolase [Endomicrobium sp.]